MGGWRGGGGWHVINSHRAYVRACVQMRGAGEPLDSAGRLGSGRRTPSAAHAGIRGDSLDSDAAQRRLSLGDALGVCVCVCVLCRDG